MWIYKWNIKIAGIGWGFSPENAWNTGDVLERTSTWYAWDWTLLTRVSAVESKVWDWVSDAAFSSAWDWDTTHSPSKNAVYDVLGDVETLLANL